MNKHDKLHHDAKAKRDRIIAEAKAEYRATVRAISELRRRIYKRDRVGRPRTYKSKGTTTIGVAERMLRESGPMSLVELTLSVQATGHRATDDPRVISRTLLSSLRDKARFRQDEAGRWHANSRMAQNG